MKTLLTVLAVALTFSGFSQNYNKMFKEDCLPADLTDSGHILIVKTPFDESDTKRNDEINEIFKTYYKFPFVVAPSNAPSSKTTYENTAVYKYKVVIEKYQDVKDMVDPNDIKKTIHLYEYRYNATIIYRAKTPKNIMPNAPDPKTLSKKEREKMMEEFKKQIKEKNIDLSESIKSTGLDDHEPKLKALITFLAKKLGNYKE